MGLPRMVMIVALWVQILLQTPQVESQEFKMTMEYNAFDDQYTGCEKKMDSKAPQLLKGEKRGNKVLRDAWDSAETKWQKEIKKKVSPLPPGFKKQYGIAVIMYTNKTFSKDFNRAVWTNGMSLEDYKKKFNYKAIHFYLTRALQLLPKVNFTTKLYRGSQVKFTHRGTGPMRFGQFCSTSQDRSISENFGTRTFYTIHACLGVSIKKFSYFPEEEEVLIPGTEVFHVSAKKGNGAFILKSTSKPLSCFNCALLGNEKNAACKSAHQVKWSPAI
ncbi:ecto-ADP-ribosyltransferase 5-like [Tachyglossus aculeatus]|uniref:ecto-ADP-ribosyltransferase 5-like n=1 Tax=Tachyglossus aculeatus TaxID=9261 RepID=UPI0018F3CB22|nr:ecto-ADP-ribosyltransferase 5-like [Tachyglossus aculeatus]